MNVDRAPVGGTIPFATKQDQQDAFVSLCPSSAGNTAIGARGGGDQPHDHAVGACSAEQPRELGRVLCTGPRGRAVRGRPQRASRRADGHGDTCRRAVHRTAGATGHTGSAGFAPTVARKHEPRHPVGHRLHEWGPGPTRDRVSWTESVLLQPRPPRSARPCRPGQARRRRAGLGQVIESGPASTARGRRQSGGSGPSSRRRGGSIRSSGPRRTARPSASGSRTVHPDGHLHLPTRQQIMLDGHDLRGWPVVHKSRNLTRHPSACALLALVPGVAMPKSRYARPRSIRLVMSAIVARSGGPGPPRLDHDSEVAEHAGRAGPRSRGLEEASAARTW